MNDIINPFLTSGYISPKYFCDREKETELLISNLISGNNVALISPRRMGKTGIILHSFNHDLLKKNYFTFFIDIYATKSLRDFVFELSKEIIEKLKSKGKKFFEEFFQIVKSLQASISFDINGYPSLNLGLGKSTPAETTLQEIFQYLNHSEKKCIVAIDEFQLISSYAEKNVEALLRTYVQHCHNTKFIFAGSQRNMMSNLFLSASKPFYQSVSMMQLACIDLDKYTQFAIALFEESGRELDSEVVAKIYEDFDGITWNMQKVLNTLYTYTLPKQKCNIVKVEWAINQIIDSYSYSYSETLFRLPEKQKELLVAIAKEKNAKSITSAAFFQTHSLSASSVQAASKGLLAKDFITLEQGVYKVYDKFFSLWLSRNY